MNWNIGMSDQSNHVAKLEALLEAAVDAIITIDRNGLIQSINKSAGALFGYRETELSDRNVNCLMPEPWASEHDDYIKRYHETGKKQIIGIGREVEGRRKDGTTFPMHLSVSEYEVNGQLFFTGIIHDLTRRKEIEIALVNAQKMEAVGQLTGGIAHDFNNLLTVITGNLELLQMQMDKEDDGELLLEALEAAQLGADLTNRLLAFARRSILSPQLVDLNALIENMSGILARTLRENIEVNARLNPDVWPVEADPGQVENALLNLAVNARDAMPDGGKFVVETSNISVSDEYFTAETGVVAGDYVRITMADTGSGMDEETLAKAFDPFFTTKEVGKGTGLGLSMVFGFALQSGGYATIYSELGIGTTVNIYLPRSQKDGEITGNDGHSVSDELPMGNGETILVVEDDDRVRKLSVERLRRLNYNPLEAADGTSALQLLGTAVVVDAVFTDMVMPGGVSGYQLTREIAQINPELPVLMTSGYAEELLENGSRDRNLPKLLRKPYKLEQLADAMKQLLSTRS